MKLTLLSIVTLLFTSATVSLAQVSASNEPGALQTESGDIVILPAQSRPVTAPVVLLVIKKDKTPIIRNVSQKRDPKMGKMENGYYKMTGAQGWGTSARLNSYGYATLATQPASATSQPIFPAGINEVEDTAAAEASSQAPSIAASVTDQVISQL